MSDIYKKSFNTGISNIAAMVSGTILLENVKMEKQRTGDTYKNILMNFRKNGIHGYFSGFFPYGAMSGFLKGSAIGFANVLINNNIQLKNKYQQKILVGVGTGIMESIVMNPIMMSRNIANKVLYENKNKITMIQQNKLVLEKYKELIKKNGVFHFYKGLNVLILKRSVDWATRFYLIEKVENTYKKYVTNYTYLDKIACTFTGAILSMPLTTPFDRFVPVVYDSGYKKVYEIIKRDGLKSLYTGGTVRILNIGVYTTFIMCFPQII